MGRRGAWPIPRRNAAQLAPGDGERGQGALAQGGGADGQCRGAVSIELAVVGLGQAIRVAGEAGW